MKGDKVPQSRHLATNRTEKHKSSHAHTPQYCCQVPHVWIQHASQLLLGMNWCYPDGQLSLTLNFPISHHNSLSSGPPSPLPSLILSRLAIIVVGLPPPVESMYITTLPTVQQMHNRTSNTNGWDE